MKSKNDKIVVTQKKEAPRVKTPSDEVIGSGSLWRGVELLA